MSAGSGAKWPALTSQIHHQTASCLQTISLTGLSFIFYLKHSLYLHWMIMRMCDQTNWFPVVSFILRHQSYPLPFLHDSALASSQRICQNWISSLSTFSLGFIWLENWENAFCWHRWLMIMRHPHRRKNAQFLWCRVASHLVACCSVTQSSSTLCHCACQASLPFTIAQSLLKFMSTELVMSYNHLVFCHPLLLLPSIFLSIRVFSNESALRIR